MNKQEFLEMKADFALIICNYEKFLKDCIMTDYYYNAQFYPLLSKIHFFEMEDAMLQRAIIMKGEGTEDPWEFIAKVVKEFEDNIPQLELKHKVAKLVVEHDKKMTKEDNAAFEELWAGFLALHHPVVKALVRDDEKALYERIKVYYYENNYEGFKEIYEKVKEGFTNPEVPEELYPKISQYYYDIRKNIGQDFTKKQQVYPYTKIGVFADEMTVAREEGELKAHLTQLVRDNKRLHEEFISAFGKDAYLQEREEAKPEE